MTEELPKKKMGVGKGCLIAVGVIVGLGVIGALVGGGDETVSTSPENTAEMAASAEAVTAGEISNAFQENEARAKMAYDGKSLLITGIVKDIDLDFMDNPVIKLKGANDTYDMGVNSDGKLTDVSISGLSQEDAAAIEKGAEMTFLCGGAGEAMGGAMLDDCSISQ